MSVQTVAFMDELPYNFSLNCCQGSKEIQFSSWACLSICLTGKIIEIGILSQSHWISARLRIVYREVRYEHHFTGHPPVSV
jgi:hypothetical protein